MEVPAHNQLPQGGRVLLWYYLVVKQSSSPHTGKQKTDKRPGSCHRFEKHTPKVIRAQLGPVSHYVAVAPSRSWNQHSPLVMTKNLFQISLTEKMKCAPACPVTIWDDGNSPLRVGLGVSPFLSSLMAGMVQTTTCCSIQEEGKKANGDHGGAPGPKGPGY